MLQPTAGINFSQITPDAGVCGVQADVTANSSKFVAERTSRDEAFASCRDAANLEALGAAKQEYAERLYQLDLGMCSAHPSVCVCVFVCVCVCLNGCVQIGAMLTMQIVEASILGPPALTHRCKL